MKILSSNEADTIAIGKRIGEKLKPGDIVCLCGELGSGKTTMVKGIASTFGIKERDITSASFTIIAEYDSPVPFYHIDLYRVIPADVAELGLQEYLGNNGVSVIEWAERAGNEISENHIRVNFRHLGEDMREIEIVGVEI